MNKRRELLGLAAAGLALAGFPYIARGAELLPKAGRRVVVVGGGYGGAIAAKYLRLTDPSIEVVLVERNRQYVSCPFSNLVIGGQRDLKDNTIGYERLGANHKIALVHQEVTGIDPAAKQVVTAQGTLAYDRLIVAPGIDFRFDEIEGYDPVETPKQVPHAWKAGEQTLLLRRQLTDMPDGGVVVVSIPLIPFRCPPGPYERICQMAFYLKAAKPKSKIIVLDANPEIVSKGALFRKAWDKHYKGLIEYRSAQKVVRVNHAKRSVDTGVEEVAGAVVNLIPPQKAGMIAHRAGLTGEDKRWCPVNQVTFESTLVKDIHVIGDACVAGAMPKSGFSASSQGKAAAQNVVALLNGKEPVSPSQLNVCYSYVNDKEAISIAGVYKVVDGKTVAVPGAGGVSPDLSELEGLHARSWITNMLHAMSN